MSSLPHQDQSVVAKALEADVGKGREWCFGWVWGVELWISLLEDCCIVKDLDH